jgi:hypothetical protein
MSKRRPDITGQRFGHWLVLNQANKRAGNAYWFCRCDCGIEKDVSCTELRYGNSRSCGCSLSANRKRKIIESPVMIELPPVDSLPFLLFAQRAELPEVSGVYIVFRGTQVLYVGQSLNIRQRWANHHRISQLSDTDRVAYMVVPSDCLIEVENQYISLLQPSLNRTPSPVLQSRRASIVTFAIALKRFWVGPLGKHDDDWLTVWAWLNNRSKPEQVSLLLSDSLRRDKPEIESVLEYTAKSLNLTAEQLMNQILDGTAPSIREKR